MMKSPAASFTQGQWRTTLVTLLNPAPTIPPALSPALGADPPSGPAPDVAPAERPRIMVIHELAADQAFTVLVALWAEDKAQGRMLAVPFVNRLANQRLLRSNVGRLMAAIDQLPEAEQTLAVELITNGAFTRRELRDPKQITAYFGRSDWNEILIAWRKSRLPTIGQVIQGIEADQHRKAKRTTAPLPINPGNGRGGTRDELVSQLKTLLPRNLRNWAPDLAEAVRTLAANQSGIMDTTALTAAVKLRRSGTGTKVNRETIVAGLPHLAKIGYVIIEGDEARICPGKLS